MNDRMTPEQIQAEKESKRLAKGWDCECGEHHNWGAWAAAHWDEVLIHTCKACGRKHKCRRGRAKLVSDPASGGAE